jgi:hypothetical protein
VKNKYIRYSLKILKWTALVIFLLYAAVWAYVYLNKQTLIAKIKVKITERTKGEVVIGDLSVSFLRTFPYFSFEVSDITIRDTMYKSHKQDFFKAEKLFARINPLAAISSMPLVSKVIAQQGSMYLATDTAGNNNHYIFRSDISDSKKPKATVLPDMRLKNMHLVMVNPGKNKLYDFMVEKLDCHFDEKARILKIETSAEMLVNSLAFNTNRGSYLENKTFAGDFELQLDKNTNTLSFKDIKVELDNHPYLFSGSFNLDSSSRVFNLNIRTSKVLFSKAVGILPFAISKKVLVYDLVNPVDATVLIDGNTRSGSKPKLQIAMNIANNHLKTPMGEFNNSNFKANFSNKVVDSLDAVDENSAITLSDFTASFEEISLRSKRLTISNLKQPFLDFDMQSDFALEKLNDLLGSTTIDFVKGNAAMDIRFKGPAMGSDTINTSMAGHILLKNGELAYVPRGVNMKNVNGTIRFANNDVFVDKLNTLVGSTQLLMNGTAKNALSKLDSLPEHMSLSWNISSPHMHLADFKSFLKKPTTGTARKKKAKFARTAGMIDKLFTEGDIALNIETPKMNYKKFIATDVNADVLLSINRMALRNVAVRHAGGALRFNGTVFNGGKLNSVAINTEMDKLDIPALFNAFNNFGQDALTTKNLKGILSASIKLNTIITDDASIVTDSTRGIVNFLLEKGELINFEPVKKIGETALKKQNFTDIKFANLQNTLEINGSSFVINKMEIRSTAMTLFVQGVYDSKKGTDMSIQVPLRNLTKNQSNTDLTEEGGKGGGISVRLRAKTGDDGKLKISWDPFRRSIKNKKEASETVSEGR